MKIFECLSQVVSINKKEYGNQGSRKPRVSVLLKFTICCYNQVFEKCPTTSMKLNAMFEAKIRNTSGEVYISSQMLVIFILSTNSTKTSP
jgi:hypothetical protein